MSTYLSKFYFSDLEIDNLSFHETSKIIEKAIDENNSIILTDINAGKIIQIRENPELKSYVLASDIIQADGQSVIWASKLLNNPLIERVAGIDLITEIIIIAKKKQKKIFFLGAKEEIVKAVVDKIGDLHGDEIIAGYRNGYFDHNNSTEIAQEIAEKGPAILLVGMTSPYQEKFLIENKEILKSINFKMGVGGSFDVIAGKVKRAPLWMQKNGLEWFYRFLQEPRRMWKRYLIGNSKFILLVLKEKINNRNTYHK